MAKKQVTVTITPMYQTDQKTDYFNFNCEEDVHVTFGEPVKMSPEMAAYINSLQHYANAKINHRDDNDPTVTHKYQKKFNVAYEDTAEVRTLRENNRLRMANKAKETVLDKLKARIESLEQGGKTDRIALDTAKQALAEAELIISDDAAGAGDEEVTVNPTGEEGDKDENPISDDNQE